MHLVNQNNKALGLLMTVALITGCASSQNRLEAFDKAKGNTGFIYAQVNSVVPGSFSKKACDSEWGGEKMKVTREKVCHRLSEFNVANVSLLKSQAIFTSNEIVPLSLTIKQGAILKLDNAKEAPFRFIEIVTQEPTDSCKWIGSENAFADDKLTTSGKVVGGFIAGMFLTIPTIGYLLTDRQGGVECEGWSYKTAYEKFLK